MWVRARVAFIFLASFLLVNSSFACSADRMLNVVLFGATGATGKAFVDLLCGGRNAARYTTHRAALAEDAEEPKNGRHVTAVTRRDFLWPVVENSPKPFGTYVLENHVMDFEDMEGTLAPKLQQLTNDHGEIDTVLCAHGTTWKAAGKNEAAWTHIDKEMTVEMARQAKAAGVKHFSLVSSAGASPDSWFMYTRTKGETIEAIKALGFERFSVFKPGLLITERTEAGTAEKAMIAIDPFLSWFGRTTGVKVLESITVEDLAASMIANALRPSPTGEAYEEYETAPDILALKLKVNNA